MPEPDRPRCPDTGTCHHACGDGACFRVLCCVPLGIAGYPDDRWPAEIIAEHQARESRGVL